LPITSPSWTAVITDEINQLRVDADSDVARAEAERDRYAAVIKKAHDCLTGPMHPENQRDFAIAALASVDSRSRLAEVKVQTLEEFIAAIREQLEETARAGIDLGDDYLHGMRTALSQAADRAEQIRKEGQ